MWENIECTCDYCGAVCKMGNKHEHYHECSECGALSRCDNCNKCPNCDSENMPNK